MVSSGDIENVRQNRPNDGALGVRIGVYAGSFDPITNGHLAVIERAVLMFDRVVVLVAINPDKRPCFSVEERLNLIRESTRHLENIEAAATAGYVVEYARAIGARFLVRGVRGATDTDYEMALAAVNRDLAPEVTTLFIPASSGLTDVSSSRLKALAHEGADLSALCPACVEQALKDTVESQFQVELKGESHV